MCALKKETRERRAKPYGSVLIEDNFHARSIIKPIEKRFLLFTFITKSIHELFDAHSIMLSI